MQYYIGIDGGGTKTAVIAAGGDASKLLTAVTGSSSWRDHGLDTVIGRIKDAVSSLCLDGEIAGMAVGLPLYGESVQGDLALEKAVQEAFKGTPVYMTNDVEAGWAGSMALAPGINVVAGTGSIAFGKNEKGETARSGGWSEFFGDEGSCYWMGRKVMEIFSKQSDGRMPRDELYFTLRRELALEEDIAFIDLMHESYIPYREKVAAMQLLAKKAAEAGAPSAIALYGEAACELCLMVASIRDRLAFEHKPFLVSYSGGLYKAGQLILPAFEKEIEKAGGKLFHPRFEPVAGALLLAFERYFPGGLPKIQKRLEEE